MNTIDLNQSAVADVVRKGRTIQSRRGAAVVDRISLASGHFQVEHMRGGKRIGSYRFKNGIVNEGKNKLLNVMFHGATQITTWYLGLIDNSGFTTLANDDIYDDINQAGNGWDEFDDYTDPANANSATTRPAWTEGAASGQSITNSSVVEFDITGTGTVKGLFVAGGGANPNLKNDHANDATLWATALFTGGDVPVLNGDTLKVTYTVSA